LNSFPLHNRNGSSSSENLDRSVLSLTFSVQRVNNDYVLAPLFHICPAGNNQGIHVYKLSDILILLNLINGSHIRRNAIENERNFRGYFVVLYHSIPPFTKCGWGWGENCFAELMQDSLEESVEPIARFLHHVYRHSMADSRLSNELKSWDRMLVTQIAKVNSYVGN
jgi:hypothetical protein